MSPANGETKPTSSVKSRRWLRWTGYVVGGLLSLVLLLACVGFVYEQIEERRDRRLNHPPGQLVDVGGFRMHLYCIGQGSPTVVLEAGLGDNWLVWRSTQPQIANFAHVCASDRAGLGWSDPSPRSRNSKVMAEELHTLLHKAGVPGPYVLVGHSMGGYNVRMYASVYPTDVVGMVLVDSAHPDNSLILSKGKNSRALQQFVTKFRSKMDMYGHAMPFGIPRLMGWCGDDAMSRAVECEVKPFQEMHDEWVNFFGEDEEQVRATGSLGNMPLVVISRDPEKLSISSIGGAMTADVERDFNQAHEAMQQELPSLSPNSSRVIAKGSGHYIQIQKPDLVIEAVHKVVDQCRQSHTGSQPTNISSN